MAKKKTNHARRPHSKVLEVRVMSPRIAWLRFLKVTCSFAKYACILAVVVGLGWGVWQGIQQAFYKNPDFRLAVIDLNTNTAIDEAGVAEKAGIDLSANLFSIQVDEVAAKLQALPELSAATVERHLPGKLVVRVTARTPRAWIVAPTAEPVDARKVGGLLVDAAGVMYLCPAGQLESARSLPQIFITFSETKPCQLGKPSDHRELAHCMRLLDSACREDAEALHWIESVRQVNEWSILLVTRDGTQATFSLGDHERQISQLRASMDHASQKGYTIDTINLIPKHNIPITLRNEAPAPAAEPAPEPPSPGEIRRQRRNRDLNTLLNRN